MPVPDSTGNPMHHQIHPRQMSKSLYIQVEYDEYYDGAVIDDMDEYLREWNDMMHTDYKSMEDFNEGEEWRAIYKINL